MKMKPTIMAIALIISALLIGGEIPADQQQFALIIRVLGIVFSLFGVVIGFLIWDEQNSKIAPKKEGRYEKIIVL
jgi:hypothetical protein